MKAKNQKPSSSSQKAKKAKTNKKISLPKIAQKIMSKVGIKKTKKDQQEDAAAEDIVQQVQLQEQQVSDKLKRSREKAKLLQEPDVPFAESFMSTPQSKFFCSNDRFIETFDDVAVYESLLSKYPDLDAKKATEQMKRNVILTMLDDEEFTNSILETYDITIHELFKFLFRLCPSIFRGMFIKKVQRSLEAHHYDNNSKSTKRYRFQDDKAFRSSRRSSIF